MAASMREYDDRDLECPVCQETFRTPKILPCGHTLCLKPCLEQLAKDKAIVTCPECRAEHTIPDGGVEKFPTNISIGRMLKQVSVRPKKPQSCPSCEAESVLITCFHCTMLVCEACRMQHTKEMQADVIKHIRQTMRQLEDVELKKDADAGNRELEDTVDVLREQVVQARDEVVQALENKTQHLLGEIESFRNEEKTQLGLRVNSAEDALTELKQFCASTQLELSTKDVLIQDQLSSIKTRCTELATISKTQKDNICKLPKTDLKLGTPDILEAIKSFGIFQRCAEKRDVLSPNQTKTQTEEDSTVDCSDLAALACAPTTPQPPPSLVDRDVADLNEVKICVGRQGRSLGQTENPKCVAVCPVTDNIIVGDHRLQVFDQKGTPIQCLSLHHFDWHIGYHSKSSSALDVAVNKQGRIISLVETTCKFKNNEPDMVISLQIYGQDRRLSNKRKISWSEVRNRASHFAIDNDDRIHVCLKNEGVHLSDLKCQFLTKYDQERTAPSDTHISADFISIFKDGTIHVMDVAGRCLSFNKDFQTLKKTQTRPEGMFHHSQVTLIENDKYFMVVNKAKGWISVYDLNWKLVKKFGNPGKFRGQLYEPTGAAVTKDGHLVVVGGNNMLQIF